MTLNRLNVQESEADVEGLASSEVKLEFEPGPEEVTGWDEVPFYFSVSPRRGWLCFRLAGKMIYDTFRLYSLFSEAFLSFFG